MKISFLTIPGSNCYRHVFAKEYCTRTYIIKFLHIQYIIINLIFEIKNHDSDFSRPYQASSNRIAQIPI